MNILILFDDTKKFCMLISSVVMPLRRRFPNISIEVSSSSDYCRKFLSHMPGIASVADNVYLKSYDKIYCFDDRISHLIEYSTIECEEYIGYRFSNGAISFTCDSVKDFFSHYCLRDKCDTNILDSFFKIFGLKWNNEGFNIKYNPRSKSVDGRNGIAIANSNLRSFVKQNLFDKGEKLWHIPLRQDPLKCIDEVNRCSNIVTDSILYAFIGSFLRKKIIFLVEDDCSFSPDIFNDIFIQPVSTQVFYAQD
ncbi:MAG: hypothetical protein H8E55_00485 [Pelagibacterales bacterium]|nr:hypothetical protein [Pelagibacterales bacterium]